MLATGMTLSNGTFDDLLVHCQNRSIPLVVYAMSGSAVARQFLGFPLTAVSAEPFPFTFQRRGDGALPLLSSAVKAAGQVGRGPEEIFDGNGR